MFCFAVQFRRNASQSCRVVHQMVSFRQSHSDTEAATAAASAAAGVAPLSASTPLASRTFLIDKFNAFRFEQIVMLSRKLHQSMLSSFAETDLSGQRVGVLCTCNYTYLIGVFAVWLARGIAVPLNKFHANSLIGHCANDSGIKLLIRSQNPIEHYMRTQATTMPTTTTSMTDLQLDRQLEQSGVRQYRLNKSDFFRHHTNVKQHDESPSTSPVSIADFVRSDLKLMRSNNNDALVLYSKAPCERPAAFVLTYADIVASVEALVSCAGLREPHTSTAVSMMPLQSAHGSLYPQLAAFIAGCQLELLPRFDAFDLCNSRVVPNGDISKYGDTLGQEIRKRLDGAGANHSVEASGCEPAKIDNLRLRVERNVALIAPTTTESRASSSSLVGDRVYYDWYNITGLIERRHVEIKVK